MREAIALSQVYQLIADNSFALTFQALGQYRAELLRRVGELIVQAQAYDDQQRRERMSAPRGPTPVLFLGGAADGRREMVDVLGDVMYFAAPRGHAAYERIEYHLDSILDPRTNASHFLYVRPGIGAAGMLVSGYRGAQS